MLYHFPEESPEDLLRKESEDLEKEIKGAERVVKHGYRHKEPSLSSLYIEWTILNNYLKCPIKKWAWPVSSKDKVELEPLPTDFLPPMYRVLRPLKYFDPETKEYVKRIVGFREIQKKREYIEYLKEIEVEIGDDDSDENSDDDDQRGKERTGRARWDIDIDIDIQSESEVEEVENVEEDQNESPLFCKSQQPFLRIARGGGHKDKKDKDKKKDRNKDKKKDGKDKEKEGKDKEKGGRKGKKGKKDKEGKEKEAPKEEGIFSKILHFFVSDDKDKDKDKAPKGKKTKAALAAEKKLAEAKKKGAETKKDEVKSVKWGLGLKSFFKKAEQKKTALEKENQMNVQSVLFYHNMFRVHAAKERDSEWLELSNTDPEEVNREIKNFDKPKAEWMVEGISFESQFLKRSMRIYTYSTTLFGRSFMKIKTDMTKGHMDFTHKKRNVIVYSLTSMLFWVSLCLIVISFVDIQVENQEHGSHRTATPGQKGNIDLESLQQEATKGRHEIEELQLNLYEIPLYVLLINLVLVAIWSVLVILGDGIFIAHYFNCWCAALAEMETSGCLGIQRLIIMHHAQFVIYACIMSTLFYFDYPSHVRQMNLLITALVVRPWKPDLRIDTPENLLPFQIAGMVFQLYVSYCTMILKLLMCILATMLKNASEMWNFKFALTFQQLASKNRGQLLRLGLNHSLLKLFTHHRILTVLLRNYGEVFSIPIMISMISEMGVMTIALVRWFFYKAEDEEAYGGAYVIIKTAIINPPTKETIKIPYYHTRAEVHLMLYLMMFQLMTQFIITTDVLARAGNSFFAGYEFVRRSGTILCRNSHQRRLIQSLEWSLSSTNPSVLSANSYFAINRATILSSFAAVAGFFSLIIQLQVKKEFTTIKFNTVAECKEFDMELYRGGCVLKTFYTADSSLNFKFP